MSRKDLISKEYMSDNVKFADAFNYYLYNGEQVIYPENLSEKDITEIVIPYGNENIDYTIEKYRDIMKKCVIKSDSNYTYFLLGIENQSDIHYAMPVRNMVYDSLNYSGQITNIAKRHRKNKDKLNSAEFLSGFTKEDKLIPVITLVIYWGNEIWDAPRSLFEMFKEQNLNTLKFVNDYRINLIAPGDIEDFSVFKSELGKVLEFINASEDLEKMKEVLQKNREYYLHMDIDSARMIETFGKTKLDVEKYEEEEKINMCKAIDDMILEGEQKGIQKGIRVTVEVAKEYGASMEEIVEKIEKKYDLSEEQARELVEKYYL